MLSLETLRKIRVSNLSNLATQPKLTPIVSVVVAVHNDEDYVQRAIRSALAQTETNIEVVCVDDGSTDSTPQLIAELQGDSRLKLLRLEGNHSAYQARRHGIEAAEAPYVMFLDGDDELSASAVETALKKLRETSADVVGFGVEVVMPEGQGTPRFARDLQPKHKELTGHRIIEQIFPFGQPAQGHLWKYLFGKHLLVKAYAHADNETKFYRANDIPVAFLALSFAQKYVSVTDRLYLYYFRRGTSGQAILNVDDFKFYLSAIDAIDSIAAEVPDHALRVYESARRSMVANLVRDCWEKTTGELQNLCMTLLSNRVGPMEIVLASADFFRAALPMLVSHFSDLHVQDVNHAENVLVTTAHLQTGGLKGVLAAQVHYLSEAKVNVIVALHKREANDEALIPTATVENITGGSWAEKIQIYVNICVDNQVDAIIDHHILYDEYWPFYSLAARAVGIPTFGWVHSFSLRPLFNGSSRLSFMMTAMPALETVVVLSPTDAAFWKMSGASNAVYLPNPPSPLLLNSLSPKSPKYLSNGPVNLLWWGRLEQSTKQVRELLKVATELVNQGTDFRLRIVGPDGPDLTATILRREAYRAGLSEYVEVLGPLYDRDLEDALNSSDMLLMTSAIEGYPLTIVEAQAHGMPVVMYELPWLAYVKDNTGVFTVPQSSPNLIATLVTDLVHSPEDFAAASAAGINHAQQTLDLDFKELYRDLLEKRLAEPFRPIPTIDDYSTLLSLSVLYSERTARTLGRAKSEVNKLRSSQKSLADSYSQKQAQDSSSRISKPATIPSTDSFKSYRSRSSSRFRKLLTRIVPGTWRQANILAERQARWNEDALRSIASQQEELQNTLKHLQKSIDRLR